MPIAHNLGFPHLGAARGLNRATEGYWGGKVSLPDILKTGAGRPGGRGAPLRDGARRTVGRAGRHGDGKDEAVRHELSLPRARTRAGTVVSTVALEAGG